jgi:hypothetical protein
MYLLGNKCLPIVPRVPILRALLTDSDALVVIGPTPSRNSAFYRFKSTVQHEANSFAVIWIMVFWIPLQYIFATDMYSSRCAYE